MSKSLAERRARAVECQTRAEIKYRRSEEALGGSAWRVSCSRLVMDYPRVRHIRGGSIATVLIVGDRPDARYAMGRSLGAAGFDVREAGSGRDALRLAQLPPQLMVLDVALPDLSGIEVLLRLKSSSATKDIPVILKSALLKKMVTESRDGRLEPPRTSPTPMTPTRSSPSCVASWA